MKKAISVLSVIFSFCLIFKAVEVSATCQLKKIKNVTVIKLKGSPYDMGYFQGEHLGQEIAGNLETDGISKFFSERKGDRRIIVDLYRLID